MKTIFAAIVSKHNAATQSVVMSHSTNDMMAAVAKAYPSEGQLDVLKFIIHSPTANDSVQLIALNL